MSKLSSHVKGDKVKWIITAIAFVLAFVMIAGVFMQVFLPDGKRPTDWFDSVKEEQPEQPEKAEGEAVITQTLNKGIKLASTYAVPDGVNANTYTLTATISPAGASAAVTYTAAWKNPSSSWASGKNVSDYVTVKQAITGSLTATVEVLQAFSEQVIVTCSVTDNPSIAATCTVDYVSTFDINQGENNECFALADLNTKFRFAVTDVIGTLPCSTEDVVDFTISLPNDITTGLVDKYPDNFKISSFDLSDEDVGASFSLSGFVSKEYYSAIEIYDMFYERCMSGISREEYYRTLYNLFAERDGGPFTESSTGLMNYTAFTVNIKYDRVYNLKSYGMPDDPYLTYKVVSWSDFPVSADGVSLDESSIIAG